MSTQDMKFIRVDSTQPADYNAEALQWNKWLFPQVVSDAGSLTVFLSEHQFESGTHLKSLQDFLTTNGYLYPSGVKAVRDEMYAPPVVKTQSHAPEPVKQEMDPVVIEASQSSKHLGQTGQKAILSLTLLHEFNWKGYSSKKTIVFTDKAGNQLVYRGGARQLLDLNRGDVVKMSFTVGEHQMYSGDHPQYPIAQTEINRPSLLAILEHAAWQDDAVNMQQYAQPVTLPTLTDDHIGHSVTSVTSVSQPQPQPQAAPRPPQLPQFVKNINSYVHAQESTQYRPKMSKNARRKARRYSA